MSKDQSSGEIKEANYQFIDSFIKYDESVFDTYPPQNWRIIQNRLIDINIEQGLNLKNPFNNKQTIHTTLTHAQTHCLRFKFEEEFDFLDTE